jgi:peptide/nickel transport system substrate-binding protein/oligopeptide transport system substrate-binding protein
MQHTRYLIFIIGVILLTGRAVQAQDANTLYAVSSSDLPTLDPAVGYDRLSWLTIPLIYRGLVGYDENLNIVGDLADQIDVSDDGTQYTFTIREDATFSNGRAVSAEDVRYTFERFFNPATQSPGTFIYDMIEGAQKVMDNTTTELSGVQVVDDRTVRFTLTRPEHTFLVRLALPFSGIVAREGVEAAGEDFARQPLGAGPYVLETWLAGQQVVFTRNPRYYVEGEPQIDRIVIDVGLDAATGFMRIESGQADITFDSIDGSDYTSIATDPNLSDQLIQSVGFPQVTYLTLDVTQPPFADIRVREALNLAIDRDRLVQLMAGLAAPANGIVPPVVPGHNMDIPVMEYNPDRAKELLTEAGYPEGFSTTMYVYTFPGPVSVSQAIVHDLQRIGISVDLVQVDIGAYQDIFFSEPGTAPMIYATWGMDYSDPTNAYEPLLTCGASSNPGGYCNPELDAQEEAAALLPPGDDRWAAFAELEANYVLDLPWVFLLYPQQYFFRSDRVNNLNSHPAHILTFDKASLD